MLAVQFSGWAIHNAGVERAVPLTESRGLKFFCASMWKNSLAEEASACVAAQPNLLAATTDMERPGNWWGWCGAVLVGEACS
jgi:hypothetical protein